MAATFQQGDPAAIFHFAALTEANRQAMADARTKLTSFVTGPLAAGFQGHGGTAAQATNMEYLDPGRVRIENRQDTNASNLVTGGKIYAQSDMNYQHRFGAVAAGGADGSIAAAINPSA